MKLILTLIIFVFTQSYVSSQDTKDSLKLKGDSLFNNQQWDESIEIYRKYVNKDSLNDEIYYKIGNAYGIIGNYNEAMIYLNKSIALNPNHAKAYCIRGVIYGFFNSIDSCFKDLDKAILLDSNFHLAYFYKGQYILLREDFESALEYFEKAISIEEKGEYYLYRGYSKAGLGMFDSACDDIHKAIQMGNVAAKKIDLNEFCGNDDNDSVPKKLMDEK